MSEVSVLYYSPHGHNENMASPDLVLRVGPPLAERNRRTFYAGDRRSDLRFPGWPRIT